MDGINFYRNYLPDLRKGFVRLRFSGKGLGLRSRLLWNS